MRWAPESRLQGPPTTARRVSSPVKIHLALLAPVAPSLRWLASVGAPNHPLRSTDTSCESHCHPPFSLSGKEWWAGAKLARGSVMTGVGESVWWSSVVPGSYLAVRWQLQLPMVSEVRNLRVEPSQRQCSNFRKTVRTHPCGCDLEVGWLVGPHFLPLLN